MVYNVHLVFRSPNRLILNFYIAINYSIVLSYFSTLLILHESLITNYSNLNDMLSRLFMNDFFLNSYYLLWTSFWYLPTFLLISFSIALINYSKSGWGYIWLLTGLVLLLVSLHYQNLNLHNYHSDNCGTNFNILLSNSVNKFHPALFYLTLFHILVALQLFVLRRKHKYELAFSLTSITFTGNCFIPVIIFTLFLGSWWALQEGSWGGWWNWDPSEVFGLFVMLYYLYTLHRSQKAKTYPLITYYLKLLTESILITYVFIQLNFDLVSHNFGTKVDQFVDTSQNFLVATSLLILIITFTIIHLIRQLSVLTTISPLRATKEKNFALTWRVMLLATLAGILLSSFSLLINDFLWKLLAINIFNSVKLTYFYTSLIITIVLIRSWGVQVFVLLLPAYTSYFSKEALLFLVSSGTTKISLFHTCIISLLFVMLSESNQSISFWEVLYENMSYVKGQLIHDMAPTFISLNNFMSEHLLGVLTNNKTSESIWNFIWTSSSNEGHGFLHSITPNLLSQLLYSGNGLSNYTINVLDFCISTSNFLTVMLLLFVRYMLKTSKLIMS